MKINLEDSINIKLEKVEEQDKYVLFVDGRTSISFDRSELKFLQALIESMLDENTKESRESLKKTLRGVIDNQKTQLQNALRKMRKQEIAFAVWYIGDHHISQEILKNMSKRSAEDVQESVRETIERKIRKERSLGNNDIEKEMQQHGWQAVTSLLKEVYRS
jgi:arsenate reductase-like glutaredoxin family protein